MIQKTNVLCTFMIFKKRLLNVCMWRNTCTHLECVPFSVLTNDAGKVPVWVLLHRNRYTGEGGQTDIIDRSELQCTR